MSNSNFVTQDQRIEDLEDIARLKGRVYELEEKVRILEEYINKLQKRNKSKNRVDSFLGYSVVEQSKRT